MAPANSRDASAAVAPGACSAMEYFLTADAACESLCSGEVFLLCEASAYSRYDCIDPDDNLRGAPELIVEVKSPSNTGRQLRELASLALANGCWECWIVDTDDASVTVFHRDGSSSRLHPPQTISLTAFGGDALPVAEIFG